jgi:hypothetical protein
LTRTVTIALVLGTGACGGAAPDRNVATNRPPAAAGSPASAAASPAPPALTPSDTAPESLDGKLCAAGETLLFGFDVPARHTVAALCITPTQTLVYRYGTPRTLQMRFPARGEDWEDRFGTTVYHRGLGAANEALDLLHLNFVNAGYCYQVYEEWSAASQTTTAGIRIWPPNSRQVTDLSGSNQRGTLADLHLEHIRDDYSCEPQ